jgi:hypothetical protein
MEGAAARIDGLLGALGTMVMGQHILPQPGR